MYQKLQALFFFLYWTSILDFFSILSVTRNCQEINNDKKLEQHRIALLLRAISLQFIEEIENGLRIKFFLSLLKLF